MIDRLHYMDHLRAGAMLLGIAFHGMLAYASPIQDFWFVRDQGSSAILNFAAVFLHSFRMPLFFFVSGYFSRLIIDRRGTTQFLKNRVSRLFLPFILFWPILAVASFGVLLFALNYLNETPPLLQYLQEQGAKQSGSLREVGTLHLWFLYYLLFFCGVAALLHNLRNRKIVNRLNALVSSGWMFILMPALISPALISAGHPIPSPDGIIPELWPFGYFGLFFALGWLLFGNEAALDRIDAHRVKAIVVATAVFAFYYYSLPEYDFPPPELALTQRLQLSIAGATATSLFVYLALSFGRQFLNIENPRVRYIADASYWLYLIHLPIVVFLQALIAEAQAFVWAKFAIVTILTTMLGVLVYRFFVSGTVIGAVLSGRLGDRLFHSTHNN